MANKLIKVPLAMSREEQIVRAAKARTAILFFLRSNEYGRAVTKAEIYGGTQDTMKELGYDSTKLDNILYLMGHNGLITRIPNPEGRAGLYVAGDVWETKNGKPTKASTAAKEEADANKVKRPYKHKVLPEAAIKVDVIKTTGRVRLTINGLIIEIGVVE